MSHARRLPKISAQLNNCGINAIVPELVQRIGKYANSEFKHDAHKAMYERLKTLFQESYQLTELSWKEFHKLLTIQVKNNSYAQQLMLGAVLRRFMSENGLPAQYNKIQGLRYPELTAEQLSKYLYAPLGFTLICHEKAEAGLEAILPEGIKDGYKVDTQEAKHSIATISIYNEGNHWERYPASQIHNAVDSKSTLPTDCKPLNNVFNTFSAGYTTKGFEKLVKAVQRLFSRLKKSNRREEILEDDKASDLRPAVQDEKKPIVRERAEEKLYAAIAEKNAKIAGEKYAERYPRGRERATAELNVKNLVTTLFKVNFDPTEIKRRAGESEEKFAARERILKDRNYAKQLQKEEIEKAIKLFRKK